MAKHGIIMNAISPGAIEASGTRALSGEIYEQVRRAISLSRFGKFEEIAYFVLFLASDKSDFITGQI